MTSWNSKRGNEGQKAEPKGSLYLPPGLPVEGAWRRAGGREGEEAGVRGQSTMLFGDLDLPVCCDPRENETAGDWV